MLAVINKVGNDTYVVFDTDDFTQEEIYECDIKKYEAAARTTISRREYDLELCGDFCLLTQKECPPGGRYTLRVVVGLNGRGDVVKLLEKYDYYPTCSLFEDMGGVVYFTTEYTDKHYYREDRSEDFERVWKLGKDGSIDKSNFGDGFFPVER